ncbi:methyltransferase family protein [Primorskyibacter sp. S87]|uniref:methyltransferase family protein n=1 Tax=Primorskyibacter sp. S87 TaxID=3415126 RepID=UPI003C7B71A0
MRRLDLPPLWLLGCIVLAWLQATYFPMRFTFGGYWADFTGGLLVGGGVILMVLAVVEMRRQKTTIHPHEDPQQLVQTGIFKRSRNPIYLGDVMVLAGFILRFDAVLSLHLIPVFTWVLERRFIVPEENRLRRIFRADFARYEMKTRRWL